MLSLPRSLAEPWWRQRDANTAESDGKAQRQRAALQGLASRPVKLHVSRSRSRGQGRQGLSHRSKTRSTNYTPWAITAHLHQAKAQTWHNCTLIPVRGKILFHRRKQYCRKMATMQATTIYRFVPQKLQPQRIYILAVITYSNTSVTQNGIHIAQQWVFALLRDLLQVPQMPRDWLYPLFHWMYEAQLNTRQQVRATWPPKLVPRN